MKLDQKWKIAVVILGTMCIVFIALLLVVRHRLRSLEISRPAHQVQAVQSQLKELTKLSRGNILSMRKFDSSSVGSKSTESEELELRRDINIFESSQRRLPVDFQDLQNGVKLPGSWLGKLNKYAKECRILVLSHESYILNCDGWRPNIDELNSAVHSFDGETGRFYKVQNHVLLYSPPPTTGTVASSKQN